MNKYEWLESVMASKMSTGVKTFAFGIFKHMNKQGTCFPGDEALMEATGMSRGHFSKYRQTLETNGWLIMETRKTKNGNSYTYSIPENAPNGEQTASHGEQSAPNGEQSAPDGGMNTVSNTATNTSREDFNTVADAPVSETSSLQGKARYAFKKRRISPLPRRNPAPVYVLPLPLPDRTCAAHRWVKEAQAAEEQHRAVLTDMGIDTDGAW